MFVVAVLYLLNYLTRYFLFFLTNHEIILLFLFIINIYTTSITIQLLALFFFELAP